MSKKVYVPKEEQLYEMQEIVGGQVYKYLLTKVVETLVMKGTKSQEKEILKSAYKYLRENEAISRAICQMYPREIVYSTAAQNNISLCLSLLEKKENNEIYNLDNLQLFENGVGILDNANVIKTTIDILSELLPQNPQYRFSYKSNSLLDDIFSTKILEKIYMPSYCLSNSQKQLAKIEPVYALMYGNYDEEYLKWTLLNEAINRYAFTYGVILSSFEESKNRNQKNILETPEAKRLIRCIKQNNK